MEYLGEFENTANILENLRGTWEEGALKKCPKPPPLYIHSFLF